MDFLDPQKQRRHTIQLFIGYFLMVVLFSLVLIILIQYVQGVAINRKGEVYQKGLAFISSQPSGADLYIDGKRVGTTNAKLNINEGEHMVEIRRNGYGQWRRMITVQGGGVEHYVYPFLFPSQLNSNAVKTFEETPTLVTQSPDRRWLVTLADVTAGRFEVFDLNKNQETVGTSESFGVPVELLGESTTAPRWEIVEWSNNNRHMLLKRYFTAPRAPAETFEYILVDRQRPEGSYNLSRTLGVTPTEISLRDKKPDAYYLYDRDARTLSTATLDEPTPVVDISEVLAYKTHGRDTVVYVTNDKSGPGRVAVKLRQGAKDFPIRTLPEAPSYVLDVARYERNWYVVMGSVADKNVYVYKNPADAATANSANSGALVALKMEAPTHVSFSANAQYILTQNGKALRVYDIENSRNYGYQLPFPIDAPQEKAVWMDANRITYVSGGKQVVFDYDNINSRTLVDSSPVYPGRFDREYKYLYSFAAASEGSTGSVLSATPLRTPSDL